MSLQQKIFLNYDRHVVPDCDRCVLSLLRPYLTQTEADHSSYSQIQLLLRQFKQAIDQGGVISVAIDGHIHFITPKAEQLLDQYFDCQHPYALPNPLRQWFKDQVSQLTYNSNVLSAHLSFYAEQAKQRLLIRLIPDLIRKQYLLLLEEQEPSSFSVSALESLGLTQREAEVLFWVAKDKSNAAIARILDCCEGTVRKHLEHLYKKLDVQTRIGAVMAALEKLELFQV